MNLSIQSTMYEIAKELNYLNAKGEVKSFSSNKGYAQVLPISIGCAVWVRHRQNDTITIDLMISQPAERKYPLECENAINLFNMYFDNHTTHETWEHPLSDRIYKVFYVDVTKQPAQEILTTTRGLTRHINNQAL